MKAKFLLAVLMIFGLSTSAMAADNLKEMFTQASVKGVVKVLSFSTYLDGKAPDKQDTAIGGTLYYKTAAFNGFSLGTAFATTNVIGEKDEGTYYGISAPGHKSVTRLQEYYLQGNWFDTQIKYGAQELNTPFLGMHPIRMLNRAYRGLSVVNKSIENLTLSGYYLTANVGWVDEKSVSFTNDVYIVGAIYKLPFEAVNTKVHAWYFTMPDSFYQTFFRVDFSKKVNDFVLHASPTVFTQKSQGAELDGALDTYQYGLSAGIAAFGFDLSGFYAKTGNDSIRDEWGYDKIIIQQVMNSGNDLAGDRSDEKAYAARLSYDFSMIGVKGLSAYVFYADYDAPASNVDETDFSIQYNFSGALEGLGLRARYAIVDNYNGTDLTDTRFYMTYRF